jgi:hypothetical protein
MWIRGHVYLRIKHGVRLMDDLAPQAYIESLMNIEKICKQL